MARASHGVERVPYLNPDAFSRFIGPKNWGQALINNELTTCLLDNGAQLNFITPAYTVERGMDIMSLDRLAQEIGGPLPLIAGMGGSLVEPTRFVLMNVKEPCVQGYDEDQIALVMDDPGMTECPVILGTSTLYQVMEVIKESEISKLAVPWSSSRISWLMQDVTVQTAFFSFILFWLFAGFLVPLCPKRVLVLGNGCEKFWASRSLLGSYVHQKSI